MELDNQDGLSTPTESAPFLVGLSPSFWAHTPMEITSLLNFVKPTEAGILMFHGQPVSKCKLVALIVSAEHKYDSHCYVVDDGTGLVDVLHWTEDEDLIPPLLIVTSASGAETSKPNHYYPGDIVAIYGKIQYNEGIVEVHATTIMKANGDDERRHWTSSSSPELMSPKQVMAKLGRIINDQISDQLNLPSADDSVGLWRLFGVHCPCEPGPIKDDLLYCRCIATPEPLDPNLDFRWALLEHLLTMQQSSNGPLQFPFDCIATETTLLKDSDQTDPTAIIRRTIRALRNDGIVYLCDLVSDTYLLISRSEVLEPLVSQFASNRRPDFLEHVPKTRLQIVRRSVLRNKEKSTDD